LTAVSTRWNPEKQIKNKKTFKQWKLS
jgi:hypothetical protein